MGCNALAGLRLLDLTRAPIQVQGQLRRLLAPFAVLVLFVDGFKLDVLHVVLVLKHREIFLSLRSIV